MSRIDSLEPGDVFGRLTVIEYSHTSVRRNGQAGDRIMLCECSCGTFKDIRSSNLKSGNTQSCGCYHSDMATVSNIKRKMQRRNK